MKRKRPYLRQACFSLLDNDWVFFVLSDEDFKETLKEQDIADSLAFVIPSRKVGIFLDSAFEIDVVRHELLHVIVDGLQLRSADITAKQLEEILADYMGDNVENYVRLSKSLYKRLRRK